MTADLPRRRRTGASIGPHDPRDLSIPDYSVRRSSRARRARLTVTPDGDAVVVLPQRAPLASAALLVERHADWLRKHVARATQHRAHLEARRSLAEGREISVNGIPHTVYAFRALTARGTLERDLEPDGDSIRGVIRLRIGGDGETPAILLERWLRNEARTTLLGRVATLAQVIGVSPTRVSVRDQRTRWGSASPSGSLSFSWRLIMAPPYVLDAVVVHELAHMRHPDHGTDFWRLARHHAPRTDDARRWLRGARRELRSALD